MTISEVIEKAGGVLIVAMKLGYSPSAILSWKYGDRRPSKAGTTRASLCKLAGVKVTDVDWELGPKHGS